MAKNSKLSVNGLSYLDAILGNCRRYRPGKKEQWFLMFLGICSYFELAGF